MVPSGSMAQLDLLAKWIYRKSGFHATPRTNRNTKSNITAETNEMASLEPALKKIERTCSEAGKIDDETALSQRLSNPARPFKVCAEQANDQQ